MSKHSPQYRTLMLDTKYTKLQFPFKLYAMLESAADSWHDSAVVSWSSDGRSFVVRDAEAFMRNFVPRHFRLAKFRSFTRQLNLWGFRSLNENCWYHKHFVRGNMDGLQFLQRVQTRGPSKRKQPDEKLERRISNEESKKDVSLIGGGNHLPLEMLGFCPQIGDKRNGSCNGSSSSIFRRPTIPTSPLPLECGSIFQPPTKQKSSQPLALALEGNSIFQCPTKQKSSQSQPLQCGKRSHPLAEQKSSQSQICGNTFPPPPTQKSSQPLECDSIAAQPDRVDYLLLICKILEL
eukprot:CAMPEP_0172534842 /NCGR_PEP_ID=MMETSP1067-20121228/7073_1 /TAXON_ID=265564 ORGANISM="Thalassiosira punctigera, Strain Tpunct2005C2" /NCGR_SAMPLE_ID=MMETSP1067 /ASSEMBLY_ACC=CAM_ASM_000444 /LENGTH=291 /DNA_ID=CAMNT_0013319687 /DNA_START=173 /DNA_END=1048 /DNA_ORIENTATION=-